ncbi:YadA-like family protein [Bartonella sp. MU70NMGDW]|uniref:YadA-like family protein n=1 Tax=Bartonella sp. MU70NMGDW TaxID=3243561 RepID=UPI0035CFA5FA
MKKIYTTPHTLAVSNLKNSCSSYRLPFIKTLSLVSVAVFLSNASPASACDLWGNVEQYFGGGTNIRKSIAPTYIINGKIYRDVGSALYGLQSYVADTRYDKLVKQDTSGLITIGADVGGNRITIANSSHGLRTLTGVADGWVSPISYDAVNGSQLFSQGISTAISFGGGAGYDRKGNWIAPTFTVKVFDKNGNGATKDYKNVADAFTGVSSSFTNLDEKIENIKAASNSLVKQDDTGLITIGGKVSGTRVSIANIDNAVRTLSGVKAGSITAASTDAINGSQLYSMSNVVAGYFGGGAGYKDGNWSAPTFTVKVFDKDGNGTEKDYKNVADAFTGVSSSFTNLDKKIENIVINGTGDDLVKQDDTGLITIGGKVRGVKVNIANVDNVARTLAGVNAGSITATSTDAINGSQFYAMSNVVASYFSDNAGYDKDGNWNAPTFTVKVFDKNGSGTEKNYKNVGDALSGVSSSFTNLNQKIESVTGDSFVKQNSAGLITIGGSKGGNRIDIANGVNAPRVLSGVKGGAFTATSTEAVNGGQIYLMTQAFASYFGGGAGYDKEGKWSAPTFTVKAFDKDGNETEKNYTNVADAFSGVNSAFTSLNEEIVKIKNKPGIEEREHIHQDGDLNDIISEGFPFMRSLPSASGNVKVPTTLTVAPKSPLKQVSFMNSKGESRRLFDIAAGEISETSTDAITGSQLYLINNQIATYFGGGSGYKGGNWSAPTFTVKDFDKNGKETEKNYTNVADAFAGVNSALAGLNERVMNGIGETEVGPLDGGLNNISEGFPFMRSARLLRSLPLAIDEEENAIDEADNSTTVTVAPSETLEQSTYEVSDGQFSQLRNSVEKLEGRLNGVKDRVTTVEKKVDVAVSYDTDDSGKKINSITLKGVDDSDPVLITNVKDGEIKAGSKDAVNGGQLYEYTDVQMKATLENAKTYTDDQVNNGVNEAKSYTDMKFDALSYDITNVRKEARQAAAIGLAVSNLRYFDDPGSVSVSFGGGFWRGQSAFAIGAGYTSEDGKIRSNLSATSAGGQWGVGGGITLKLK